MSKNTAREDLFWLVILAMVLGINLYRVVHAITIWNCAVLALVLYLVYIRYQSLRTYIAKT